VLMRTSPYFVDVTEKQAFVYRQSECCARLIGRCLATRVIEVRSSSLLTLLLAFALAMQAAAPPHACDPDDATFQLLRQWRMTSDDARLAFEERMAPLWKTIEAQPDNVFLHHAYQAVFRTYIEAVRRGPVDAGYRRLMEAHPNDLSLKYAYARFLWGSRTADSKRMLEEVITADPEFPWAHLALARVYQNKQFESKLKQREETERFFALCPGALAVEAYDAYRRMPQEFRVKAGTALRDRLKNANAPRELMVLPSLWEFEFQGAADQAQVRIRIADDLARVRKLAEHDLTLLDVALQGYNLIEDRDGARWAREHIAAVAPQSFMSCNVAIDRWYGDRALPTMEDSRERVQGYYRELLEATDAWVQICPLAEAPWSSRFRAIRELPNQPAEKLLQAGEGLLRASAANSSNWFVAPSLMVGELYEQRGIGFDRIPALIERNHRDAEARLESDRNLDWLSKSWREDDELDATESYLQARVLAIRKYLHESKSQEAAKELAAAERDAVPASGDKSMWRLQPHLIDAYLAMGDTVKARAALDSLKTWLASQQPTEMAGRNERLTYRGQVADYWERAGGLAELEKRPKAALSAYENLLQYRSNWGTLAERFSVIDKTAAFWKVTGGTQQAWEKWLRQLTATISVPAQNWDKIDRTWPDFALSDLSGRKWTQHDLKGKVTIVNIWATWCGPCVAELPYVQKVQNSIKGREDAQVITLNIDDNPGLIVPFLKQRGVASLTVIPAMDFVERILKVNGFPRTWIVDADGVARREQAGFTGEPAKWVEQVLASLKAGTTR
jgi:thiol-disulfide isomerase/thioredoxin